MVAFDGQHFSEGAMKMVNYLNSKIPMSITGVFISPVDYRELLGYSGMGMGTPIFTIPVGDDEKMLEQTAKKFREYCRKNKLPYHTHKDTNLFAMEKLIRETRFADLETASDRMRQRMIRAGITTDRIVMLRYQRKRVFLDSKSIAVRLSIN